MPANYLHGVEILTIKTGARPVNVVKSAVIGLVGLAPKGPVNAITLVRNPEEAAQFGLDIEGFTIPRALSAIFAQGNGTVLVINAMSNDSVKAVTSEIHTVTDGKFQTTIAPINTPVVKNADGTTTYVNNIDYTVDEYGRFRSLTIANAATVKITYNCLDPERDRESVIEALIGSTTDGVSSGMVLFDSAYAQFGFVPRILIVPEYTDNADMMSEMLTAAAKFKAFALFDSVLEDTVVEAIQRRGISGLFNTSNKRAFLLYPWIKGPLGDPRYAAGTVQPYSSYFAGVIAATDQAEGYWVSPSNHEINGVSGIELLVTTSLTEATADTNLLNEAGITTVFQGFGTGIRTWGNRSAAFPTNTHPENFMCVQRTADVIDDSITQAMLQFIDRPINNAIIDDITETVNAFLRTLAGRGAIIDGQCWYDPTHNSAEELAAGHIVFDYDFMPPTPAERMTFRSLININYLKGLAA